jgi:hypothetical protein
MAFSLSVSSPSDIPFIHSATDSCPAALTAVQRHLWCRLSKFSGAPFLPSLPRANGPSRDPPRTVASALIERFVPGNEMCCKWHVYYTKVHIIIEPPRCLQ